MRSLLRVDTKAPIAVAGLIAVPLYFAALMASSLALDAPRLVGKREFPGAAGTEAKIWAAALIAPAIVLAAGLVGLLLRRFGIYLVSAAGIAVCLALPGMSQGWIAGHERRFPLGIDFVKDSSPSNLSNRGDWEHAAQATIVSITHWTVGLAIAIVVVGVLVEVRRRRGAPDLLTEPSPIDVELDTGGAPPQLL